jgi:hypothetical protein
MHMTWMNSAIIAAGVMKGMQLQSQTLRFGLCCCTKRLHKRPSSASLRASVPPEWHTSCRQPTSAPQQDEVEELAKEFNRAPLPDFTQPKPGLPLPLETKLLAQANFQYDPNSQYQVADEDEEMD